MTSAAKNDFSDLFTRDGHLTELTYDRLELGELDEAQVNAVASHTESCDRCQALSAELDALGAGAPGPPAQERHEYVPPPSPGAPRTRARRGGRAQMIWAGAAVAISAAAAVLMFVIPGGDVPPDDGIRTKGAPIDLEVFVDREDGGTALDKGDKVHPGDRLGFRVHAREAGHIMIVGVDSTAEPYLCYPQKTGGVAAPTDAMTKAATLQEAVELDDVLGEETLILVHCAERFAFDSIRNRLGDLPEGCRQKELRLVKALH